MQNPNKNTPQERQQKRSPSPLKYNILLQPQKHHNQMINPCHSWTCLLRHRMAPGGLVNLIKILDAKQWPAIEQSGFGGILAI